jgi:hypothetical protein
MADERDRPFPPDPKVSEETSVPGPKLTLSPQQAKSVAEMAKRGSHVEVEDSGAGYLKVRSFDSEGEPNDERWIDSDGFDRLRSLLRHKDLPE